MNFLFQFVWMIQYLWWDICRHILASPSEPFISSQWPVDDKHTKLPRWEIHCTNTWHLLCTSILLLSCHKALPYPSLIISIFFIFILPSEDLYCCLWFEIETEHSVFSDTRIKMCFFASVCDTGWHLLMHDSIASALHVNCINFQGAEYFPVQ